jgi:hypothetical protein
MVDDDPARPDDEQPEHEDNATTIDMTTGEAVAPPPAVPPPVAPPPVVPPPVAPPPVVPPPVAPPPVVPPPVAPPPVVPPPVAPPAAAGATPTWNINASQSQPTLQLTPYLPEKQQDYVRLTFTVGLLVMFGWVIVWASIESASWPEHWEQTKDMLQIILPALTGLIGSVSGFYFGSRGNTKPG